MACPRKMNWRALDASCPGWCALQRKIHSAVVLCRIPQLEERGTHKCPATCIVPSRLGSILEKAISIHSLDGRDTRTKRGKAKNWKRGRARGIDLLDLRSCQTMHWNCQRSRQSHAIGMRLCMFTQSTTIRHTENTMKRSLTQELCVCVLLLSRFFHARNDWNWMRYRPTRSLRIRVTKLLMTQRNQPMQVQMDVWADASKTHQPSKCVSALAHWQKDEQKW